MNQPMTFAQKREIVECKYSKVVYPNKIQPGQTLKAKTVAQELIKAQESLNGPYENSGHEARSIAMAEACKSFRLPNELVFQILIHVEPIAMYRAFFPTRWLVVEDEERGK